MSKYKLTPRRRKIVQAKESHPHFSHVQIAHLFERTTPKFVKKVLAEEEEYQEQRRSLLENAIDLPFVVFNEPEYGPENWKKEKRLIEGQKRYERKMQQQARGGDTGAWIVGGIIVALCALGVWLRDSR